MEKLPQDVEKLKEEIQVGAGGTEGLVTARAVRCPVQ